MFTRIHKVVAVLLLVSYTISCRKDDTVVPPVTTPVDTAKISVVKGFYLLNEANMGSNKASIDYYDYTTGNYNKNIYPTANPGVVKELGDVGNDIRVYGSKLYAVINVSNKVEVMDVKTAKRLGQIDIPNCRYITFANGKAYVSAYTGPVSIDPNAPLGLVAEIDTASLAITREVSVGYQPEELAIVDNKIYVANSGGYRPPNYDSTISVIDISSFRELKKINVAINLHRLKADRYGHLIVTSRGDYYNTPSKVFVVDTKTETVIHRFDIAGSNLAVAGDTAFLYGSEFNYNTGSFEVTYNMIDLKNLQLLNKSFITDGTEAEIQMPYGLAVNPVTRDIFVTDAKDYVSPGTLFCFDPSGKKKWSVTTGDIPAHIAFVIEEE
ncbi:hypothetical protein COR50_11590 [Chitinophaga caeni]|uniref:YncE family protein n=1 Tax=Chitinophaga caeni TaxID=2029983 RepID=A0A291QV58_9BACT|nr:DUF5074 domain-containing protein [Chitinophaga caeni]ATL47753.1 hypothetical protein COR50_11590 [Chitinophaga caeni]